MVKKRNEPQNITSEVQNYLKTMDLEQGLYAQADMIRRRESYDIKEKYKTINI